MKLFITGGQGFIGSNLKNFLLEEHESEIDNITIYDLVDGNDILNYDNLVVAMKDHDAVVHLASLISVPESKEKPYEYINTNVLGTINVLKASKENGIKKIVFASSAAVYEPTSSIYALSKAICEHLPDSIDFDGDFVSLRFFNVFGPGQDADKGAVIPKFIKEASSKNPKLTIYGSGMQTRDFVHVRDVANAIYMAIVKKDYPSIKTSIKMDVGTGTGTSINDLVGIVGLSIEKPIKIEYKPTQGYGIEHSQADIVPIRELLGWEPEISVIDGVIKLIRGK